MTEPRKPWWKKRRWIGAAVLAVSASYVSSAGPFFYLWGRRWLTPATGFAGQVFFAPVTFVSHPKTNLGRTAPGRLIRRYTSWWRDLGWEHSGQPDIVINGRELWNAGTDENPRWVTQPP